MSKTIKLKQTNLFVAVVSLILISILAGAVLAQSGLLDEWLEPGEGIGTSTIGFTLHFTDGSELELGPATASLIPLVITAEGKELAYINIRVLAKFSGDEADITESWSADTSLQVEFYKRPSTTPKMSSTADYEKEGTGHWVSGVQRTVAVANIQAGDIDGCVATYGEGTWHLQANAIVKLTTVASGQPRTYTASAFGGIDFDYTVASNPSILSVTIDARAFSVITP